jgi:hypothetical protein
MSRAKTIWLILWNRASQDPAPFEIAEVVSQVAKELSISEHEAQSRISGLLHELARMPDGEQFFTQEGYAVVALPEFLASPKDADAALEAYPFEL